MGKPSHLWPYFNAEGSLVGYAARWDLPSGKQFRPLTLSKTGRWRQKGIPTPRPLYNLSELSERPQDQILVVEGEKTCDAAGDLLPSFVSVTSAGGAMAPHLTDWAPLKGRSVTIWPDNDPDGFAYAENVAKLAHEHGASSVKIVALPEGLPAHWDLADRVPDGVEINLTQLLAEAHPVNPENGKAGSERELDEQARRLSPGDQLLRWAIEEVDLFSDGDETYADLWVEGVRETALVHSKQVKRWLRKIYFERTGKGATQEAVSHSVENLDALAVRAGHRRVYLRTASHGGRLYIDLADDHRHVVEIDDDGWRVITDPPVRFRRPPTSKSLPMPARTGAGESLKDLRGFLNVSDDDFVLCVAWLLGSLRDTGPFPLLILTGEEGSAKSTAAKMLRSFVDPADPPTRGAPKDEWDAAIATRNNWTIVFDNLSGLPTWLSDTLCRFSSGEAHATRALYTNNEEVVTRTSRPVVLTGINNVAVRGDLADRSLIIRLDRLPETENRAESSLWADFEQMRPRIFAALLDGLSVGIQQLRHVRLDRLPRMAEFATWVSACESAYWPSGTFMAAYNRAQASAVEDVLEDSLIWQALRKLLEERLSFEGTAAELLSLIKEYGQDQKDTRGWPSTGAALGKTLTRLAPSMRKVGFKTQRRKSNQRNYWLLEGPKLEAGAENSVPASGE